MSRPRATTALAALLALVLLGAAGGQELKLATPEGWRQERIELPPGFAPEMKLRGVEEIRFAPGMFDADSDSFFSYVFAFRVELEPKLDRAALEREMMTYYRGLAAAVLKGKEVDYDPKGFALKLQPAKEPPVAEGPSAYVGDLKWVEPFVTQKNQDLHLELHAWRTDEHAFLFVCASPQQKSSRIWKQMRDLRAAFMKAN